MKTTILSVEKVLAWCDATRKKTGQDLTHKASDIWQMSPSGHFERVPGETGATLDKAIKEKLRGLVREDGKAIARSLEDFIARYASERKRPEKKRKRSPKAEVQKPLNVVGENPLREEQIVAWILATRKVTGRDLTRLSSDVWQETSGGLFEIVDHETGETIDRAFKHKARGLVREDGASLAQSLEDFKREAGLVFQLQDPGASDVRRVVQIKVKEISTKRRQAKVRKPVTEDEVHDWILATREKTGLDLTKRTKQIWRHRPDGTFEIVPKMSGSGLTQAFRLGLLGLKRKDGSLVAPTLSAFKKMRKLDQFEPHKITPVLPEKQAPVEEKSQLDEATIVAWIKATQEKTRLTVTALTKVIWRRDQNGLFLRVPEHTGETLELALLKGLYGLRTEDEDYEPSSLSRLRRKYNLVLSSKKKRAPLIFKDTEPKAENKVQIADSQTLLAPEEPKIQKPSNDQIRRDQRCEVEIYAWEQETEPAQIERQTAACETWIAFNKPSRKLNMYSNRMGRNLVEKRQKLLSLLLSSSAFLEGMAGYYENIAKGQTSLHHDVVLPEQKVKTSQDEQEGLGDRIGDLRGEARFLSDFFKNMQNRKKLLGKKYKMAGLESFQRMARLRPCDTKIQAYAKTLEGPAQDEALAVCREMEQTKLQMFYSTLHFLPHKIMNMRYDGVSYSDVFQTASLYLLRAIEKWDPSIDIAFSSFVKRDLSLRLPAYLRDSFVTEAETECCLPSRVSVSVDFLDRVPDETALDPFEIYAQKERAERLDQALSKLEETRDEVILRRRYGIGDVRQDNLSKIANDHHFSNARANQIEMRALERARSTVLDFLPDEGFTEPPENLPARSSVATSEKRILKDRLSRGLSKER